MAALLLVVGALGLLTLVETSASNMARAKESQVAADRLQREIERIKQLDYRQIAIAPSDVPAHSLDAGDSSWRVSGTQFATNSTGTAPMPLVVDPDGVVGSTDTFQDGQASGTIHRYVVWDDSICTTASPPGTVNCNGRHWMKRVIVTVRINGVTAGPRPYQELQTQIADPSFGNNPGTTAATGETPWTFWLTDTPCSESGRVPLTGDHLSHNTRGTCSAGGTTGNTPGAPDLLETEAVPLVDEHPLYDYATDVEPLNDSGTDRGLQLRVGASCAASSPLDIATGPDADATRFQKIHKWLSQPIPAGPNVQLAGSGNLSLWTHTIGDTSYLGKICVTLFVRHTNAQGASSDGAVYNTQSGTTYFSYQSPTWSGGNWTEVTLPMSFSASGGAPVQLGSGDRLGLAISVDPTTAGDGLQFLYEEPTFDSRLQLSTVGTPPF